MTYRSFAFPLATAVAIAVLPTGTAIAQTNVSLSGFTEATFGLPSPSLPYGQYFINYTDVNSNNRRDAGIELGEGSYDSRNYVYWRFDNQNRRHGNLYEMNSTAFSDVLEQTPFAISQLSYFNAEVFATSASVFTLPVSVKLNLTNQIGVPPPTFNFDFRLSFTTNNPGPVDDTLEFINAQAPQTFSYGNKTYTLALKGFSNDNGSSYTNTFQLPEYQSVSSTLFAEIVEVQGPRLYMSNTGNVLMQARVGTTVSQDLLVQNSGAAGTTLTGTITGIAQPSEFGPEAASSFTLAAGQSVSRTYTYTPTARTNGIADAVPVVVSTVDAGSEDVYLLGQAYGPVYYGSRAANSTINLGRVVGGSGGATMSIANVTPDGELAQLTDMTLRSLKVGGSGASSFNLSGISDGDVIAATASRTLTIGTNAGARGARSANLTIDTDVDTANGADGRDFRYNLAATIVDKRPINASTLALGRVMVDETVSAATTISSQTVDNFYTNPTLRKAGGTAGGVTIGAAASDALINTTAFSQARGATATFTTHGNFNGAVNLGVTPEGLIGEGNYALAVLYSATAVRKRQIEASVVDFGRVMAGVEQTGFTTEIRGLQTSHNFYTNPTLNSAGNASGGVSVGSDSAVRTINSSSGVVVSTRDVTATFATGGQLSGAVALDVTPEGLQGEGTYALSVPWTANAVADRQISASTVDLGRHFVGAGTLSGTSTLASTGTDDAFTRVTLQGGTYTDGVATASVGQTTQFRGTQTASASVEAQLVAPGAYNNAITVSAAAGAIAGEGLVGEYVRDLSIPYTADIFSHGRPSFTGGAFDNTLDINFGTLQLNTGVQTLDFSLHNLISSERTAAIEFDGIGSSAGQTSKLFTNLPSGFSDLIAGGSQQFSARFDTSTAGTFSAQYVLSFFDDRTVGGAGALDSLTLNLLGTVAGESVGPPRTNIVIFNPGFEQVRSNFSTVTDLPTLPGDYTLGMSSTILISGGSQFFRFIPGWVTESEGDGLGGILHADESTYSGGYTGTNIAYVAEDESVEQNVLGTFDPDETYTFSFKVGRPTGGDWSEPDVGLYLGGVLFEPLSFDRPVPAPGQFETWTALYRVNPDDPLAGLDLAIRILGTGGVAHLDDFLLYISGDDSGPSSSAEWIGTAGGYWSDGNNWSGGQGPNSTDSEARFGSSITRSATVAVNLPVTLGTLRFDNPNFSYDLHGPASLKMRSSSGKALIDVASGSHKISTDLQLATDTSINTAVGSQLTIGGSVSGVGSQGINKSGTGTLRLTGNNTYTGLTSVGGGRLVMDGVHDSAHGGYVVSGGVLEVGGAISPTNTPAPMTILAAAQLDVGSAGSVRVSRLESDGAVANDGIVRITGGGSINAGITGTGTLGISGGDVVAGGMIEQSRLELSGTGRLALQGGVGTMTVGSLAITDSAALDIGRERLVVDYTAQANPSAQITALLASGFNYGTWDGPGITSGDAAVDANINGLLAVGMIDNAEYGYPDAPEQSVIVRLAYYGDADINGVVNLDDFSQFLYGYRGGGEAKWLNGDFDYSGVVDLDDFSFFLYGFRNQGLPLSALENSIAQASLSSADQARLMQAVASIPEPSGLLLLGVTGMFVGRRKRWKDSTH